MAAVAQPLAWMLDAACPAHPDLDYFTAPYDREREVCAGCLVRSDCLDHAVAHGITEGLWGGLDGKERRQLSSGS